MKKQIFDFIFVFSLITFICVMPPIGLWLEYVKHVNENIITCGIIISTIGTIVGHIGNESIKEKNGDRD